MLFVLELDDGVICTQTEQQLYVIYNELDIIVSAHMLSMLEIELMQHSLTLLP